MITTDDLASKSGGIGGPYFSFLAWTAGMMAVGLLPTRQLAGDSAVTAMVIACSISLVAALMGTVPVIMARGLEAANTLPALMFSIVLRLGVVILLGVAAVWSGKFDATPLLLWLVLSHAVLQVADIRFTKRILYQRQELKSV